MAIIKEGLQTKGAGGSLQGAITWLQTLFFPWAGQVEPMQYCSQREKHTQATPSLWCVWLCGIDECACNCLPCSKAGVQGCTGFKFKFFYSDAL